MPHADGNRIPAVETVGAVTAMRDRLIVALDVPTVAEAGKVVDELGDAVSFYKVGYQLAFAGGLDFARELAAGGKKVFLDMKLLDIDNTVARGVENIAKMGMAMLTLHAYPKAMKAAVEAARGSDLILLAVTVLTSMDGRTSPTPATATTIRARWCCAGPARRWRRAWAASSARPRRRLRCAPSSGRTLRWSRRASAPRARPMAIRSAW